VKSNHQLVKSKNQTIKSKPQIKTQPHIQQQQNLSFTRKKLNSKPRIQWYNNIIQIWNNIHSSLIDQLTTTQSTLHNYSTTLSTSSWPSGFASRLFLLVRWFPICLHMRRWWTSKIFHTSFSPTVRPQNMHKPKTNPSHSKFPPAIFLPCPSPRPRQ